MKTNIVKIDYKNNYFVDGKDNEKIVGPYDPNNKDAYLLTTINTKEGDVILIVLSDKIKINSLTNQIYFDYDNQRYLVDDGYQNFLIRTGYICIDKSSSQFRPENRDKGLRTRIGLLNHIHEVVSENIESFGDIVHSISIEKIKDRYIGLNICFESNGFTYNINIDTINSIVSKNQIRKTKNLSFYPFDKNKDKYSSLYMTIFCKKTKNATEKYNTERYEIADRFIKRLIALLNQNMNDEYRDDFRIYFSGLRINRTVMKVYSSSY